MRAKTTPVLNSILAKDGHNYPIYCLNMIGTKNANNIISISNDAKVCQWTSEELNNPKIHFSMF